MRTARAGDTVRVHYTGRMVDGSVIESSRGREPLEFTLGLREVIPGLEEAVAGMRPGETKTAQVPAERAHGLHRNDLLLAVERARFPAHIRPSAGQRLRMTRPGDDPISVTVLASCGEVVLVDANHPHAGQELTFEIELLSVVRG